MGKPFWNSVRYLMQYKPQMAVAALGLIISTTTFGSGLTLLLPTTKLLLGNQLDLPQLTRQYLVDAPNRPQFLRDFGQAIMPHLPSDQFQGFVYIMAVIAVLTIVGSIGRFLHEYLTITVASRATMVWRDQIFSHLIRVPVVDAMRTSYQDQISRLVSDTRILADGLQTLMGRSLAEILKIIVALVVAFLFDWRIALLAVFGAPGIFILLRKFGKKVQKASRRAMNERGKMSGALNEALSGLSVVKVHNAEGYERRRFRHIARTLFSQEMKMRAVKAYSSPLTESLTVLGLLVVAGVAAWLIIHKQVDQANFLAVLGALGVAAGGIKPLTGFNHNLYEAIAASERLAEMQQLPIEPSGREDRQAHPDLPRHQRDVVFEKVSYRYPGQDRNAVEELSLTVRFGQTIAVVGANGSGKSTLINLLPRLTDPTTGRVLIDGHDLRQVNLRSLRAQLAVVTQQTILFQGTIADNIAYGRRYETLDRIMAAAQSAFADDFIQQLPQGYQTVLGEDGSGLSGGQRQRLCIARAILRNPSILILDEATSQIDADSEAKINRALAQFRTGRTTFIIAHRLSTVVDADLILVMNQGVLVDVGKHQELLLRCQVYQTLTQTQLRQFPPAMEKV